MGGKAPMAKPRRVSAMSSVLKEAQEYKKVTQEEEQVIANPVEQETVNTETQKSVSTVIQKAVNTEASERTHKQTIVISESLALRLKVHAAKHKETIASIATRAFEKLLAEEGE
jgi:hypothetical protein